MINADHDALIEVVMNILSNAIKYSDEKRVVSISTQKSGMEAVLRIQDEGIGIPETSIARIFDPFLRIQFRTDHNAGGTGLGLTIVKHIMDAHNGRIEVTSIVNKGSTFSLFFPLKYSLGDKESVNITSIKRIEDEKNFTGRR
jgi:two-component system phosphate regulon sensor histidine kinase PhoR